MKRNSGFYKLTPFGGLQIQGIYETGINLVNSENLTSFRQNH